MGKKVEVDLDSLGGDAEADEIFTDLAGGHDPLEREGGASGKDKTSKDEQPEDDFTDLRSNMFEEEDRDEDEDGEDEPAEIVAEIEAPAEIEEKDDPRDLELRQEKLRVIALEAGQLEEREFNIKAKKTEAEGVLTKIKDRLIKAKEDGDVNAEFAAQEDWAKARDVISQADRLLIDIESKRPELIQRINAIGFDSKTNSFIRQTKTPSAASAGAAPSKLATAFINKNAWYNDPKFARKAALIREIDKDMADQISAKTLKLDKEKPEYFAELARRFNAVSPGLVKGLDGKMVATGTVQRGSTARGAGVRPSAGARVASEITNPADIKLNAEDKANMGRFGMDWSNPKHRNQYLLEKRAQAKQAPRRRA